MPVTYFEGLAWLGLALLAATPAGLATARRDPRGVWALTLGETLWALLMLAGVLAGGQP